MRNIAKLSIGVAATLAVLVSGAAAANAEIGEIGSFGQSGPGALERPRAIAVDQETGDVYVVDTGHTRVVKYDAAGGFILTFGREVNKTKVEQAGSTEAEQDLCTATSGDECQAGTTGTGPGQFQEPAGVAVDPNTGDVYVGDKVLTTVNGKLVSYLDNRVEKFDANGSYISEIDSGTTGTPSLDLKGSLAVDLDGNLYASDYNQVFKFESSGIYAGVELKDGLQYAGDVAVDARGFVYVTQGFGESINEFTPAGLHLKTFPLQPGEEAREGLAVDLATGNVFLVIRKGGEQGEVFVREYSSSGVPTATLPLSGNGELQDGELAYGTVAGRLYLTRREFGHEEVVVYGPFSTPTERAPAVVNESSSGYGLTTVRIAAKIAPNLRDTSYSFQYGMDPTFASATNIPVSPADIGSGFLPVSVKAELSGLQQSTTYYYRVLAHSSFGGGAGSTTTGPTETFTTLAPPPAAQTEGAAEVAFNSATLSGTVLPGSVGAASDTRWCFEYGTAGGAGYSLGSLPLLAGDAGQGTGGVPVSVHLVGLEPGSTYRYRLLAVNSLGLGQSSTACGTEGGRESDGAEATFTTPVSLPGPVAVTGPASGVSQNEATVAGTVDPNGFRTSYEFQVGVDTGYGVQVFGEAGAGSEARQVSLELSYLQPGTTYHYRLVAVSPGGTRYGADATFTTSVFPTSALSAPVAAPLVATPAFAFPRDTAAGSGKAKSKGRARKRGRRRKPVRRRGKKSAGGAGRAGKGRGK
jgi:hypothetical protein